ncbi:MAG: hypothetical protein ACO3TX_11485, partial [Pseudomonadales bacterium]
MTSNFLLPDANEHPTFGNASGNDLSTLKTRSLALILVLKSSYLAAANNPSSSSNSAQWLTGL